jgi:Flp pilus assembly protein TadG
VNRWNPRSDRGAAAVEMAIVLPLLLLVVFGIIDYGRLLNERILVTSAAREGARLAAVNAGVTAGELSGEDVKDQVKAGLGGTAEPDTTVTLCKATKPTTGPDVATVTVKVTFGYITPIGGLGMVFGGGGSTDDGVSLESTVSMPCQNRP